MSIGKVLQMLSNFLLRKIKLGNKEMLHYYITLTQKKKKRI